MRRAGTHPLSPLPPESATLLPMVSAPTSESRRELSPRTRDILATSREAELRRDVERMNAELPAGLRVKP